MDIQHFLIHIQHIHWQTVMKNYHARHYMFEMAKILIPALITGVITFLAMRITDSRNKKRWLNDGHIKRKTELEIQIRKFLLGINGNISDDYEILVDLCSEKSDIEIEEIDSKIIYDFNKDFETLSKYLEKEENERGSNIYDDKSIFTLMDEYACYVPKIQPLFDDFKALCNAISDLKTIYENDDSNSRANILDRDVKTIVKKQPEHFEKMANAYLCFQDVVGTILNKLMVKKIIK